MEGNKTTLRLLQEEAATQQDCCGGGAGREDARTGEPTQQRLSGSRISGVVVGGFASCHGETDALSRECLERFRYGTGFLQFASDEWATGRGPQSCTGPHRHDVKKARA